MIAIDYNLEWESCLECREYFLNEGPLRTQRSSAFNGGRLSRHFGTKKFNFFQRSYLFRQEDQRVTDIAIDIHERWLEWNHWENSLALDQESDELALVAQCDRRRNRKKWRRR